MNTKTVTDKICKMADKLCDQIDSYHANGKKIPPDTLVLFKIISSAVIEIQKNSSEEVSKPVTTPLSTFEAIAKTRDDAAIALERNLELMNKSSNKKIVAEAIANVKTLNDLIAKADEQIKASIEV